MKIEVVIPAYNEAKKIDLALTALAEQELPAKWELGVIVADDGSVDQTANRARAHPLKPQVLNLKHQGRSAARNAAVEASQAEVVLLLAADIILRPGAVAAHCLFHEKNPSFLSGAVGHVVWDPRVLPTPLMEWMVHGGQQNDFDIFLAQREVDPRHYFYGSHLSLKRGLLRQHKFSTELSGYGWEDLELGRRLAAVGFKLYPLSAAVGLHHHHYSAAQIRLRQEMAGKSLQEYERQWSEVGVSDRRGWRTLKHLSLRYSGLYALSWKIISRLAPSLSFPRVFSTVSAWAFWRGYFLK